jgi:predicted acetyltransferase
MPCRRGKVQPNGDKIPHDGETYGNRTAMHQPTIDRKSRSPPKPFTDLTGTPSNVVKNGMNFLSARVTLVHMAPGRDAEFAQMFGEFRNAGELDVYKGDLAIAWKGYDAFYALISQMKAGGYPRPDIVPMDAYFIEAEGRTLGELYIRHRLSPRLEQVRGHVGYKIRPSCRNQGVATAALRIALRQLASHR